MYELGVIIFYLGVGVVVGTPIAYGVGKMLDARYRKEWKRIRSPSREADRFRTLSPSSTGFLVRADEATSSGLSSALTAKIAGRLAQARIVEGEFVDRGGSVPAIFMDFEIADEFISFAFVFDRLGPEDLRLWRLIDRQWNYLSDGPVWWPPVLLAVFVYSFVFGAGLGMLFGWYLVTGSHRIMKYQLHRLGGMARAPETDIETLRLIIETAFQDALDEVGVRPELVREID